MKKRLLIGVIIVLIAGLVIGYFLISNKSATTQNQFKTAEVTKGDLENTISSSGTLSPVTTVTVGTEVSGTLAEVYVDFNDEVKKGQLLAIIDTVQLKASLLDAEAGLEKAEAELELAQAEYNRNYSLYENKLISESEFLPYSVSLKTQKASLISGQAALDKATRNLKNAYIYSPINGIVIDKSVEAGQTVAASYSTPELFEIAGDLSSMEILASVDESDIGSIKAGQDVRFDVQAYSDKVFTGQVTQVRLQPETVSNVVTYTVVISAANEEDLLFPGMTATVDFIIEKAENALLVPNSALSFKPSEELSQEVFKNMKNSQPARPDSGMMAQRPPMPEGGMPPQGGSAASTSSSQSDMGRIWYLDSNGKVAMEPVKIGLTDGSHTEIVMSRNLQEGMQVIVGLSTDTSGATTTTKSSSTSRMGGPPPGGPGF